MAAESPPPPDVSQDAARIASGGGIVLAGSLVDRALRLLLGMLLARMLGVDAFGSYQYVVRTLTVIAVAAPMGQDISMVFFGARFRKLGDLARLKGSFLFGAATTTVLGVALAAATGAAILGGHLGDDGERAAMLAFVPVIALMPVLNFLVSCLRAFKDMRGNAIAFQLVLPISLLVGQIVAVGLLGGGVVEALLAFLASQVCAILTAAVLVWRHYGSLLMDRSIRPRLHAGRQLAYAIPQGVMGVVFRANTWMDVIMLGWLMTDTDVGQYAPATALVAIGAVPAVSLNTMFNPVISELVHSRELARLGEILKVLTRWLLIFAVPFFAVLLLVPDGTLGLVYGPDYTPGATALQILVIGSLFSAVFAPTMRVIPMSGHSLLNLINGLFALGLTVTLNYLLIPRYGIIGAAMGTTITLSAWSVWRLIEVWHLFRLSPISRRTLLVGGVCGGTLGGLVWLTAGSGVGLRVGVTAAFLLAYVAFVYAFGREADDALITARLQKRLGRLLGRRRG